MATTKRSSKNLPLGIQRNKFSAGMFGTKKLAPVNVKKEAYQYVIDGYLVSEVLKQLPDTIKILGAKVGFASIIVNRGQIVPNNLKKIGVQTIRVSSAQTEVSMVFDETTKATIEKNVKKACEELNIPVDRAYFRYIILSNDTAHGRFEYTTKEIKPDETDQRKKLKVLGLKTAEGRIQGLVADINAKKYVCTVKEETVRLLMCSKA